MTHRILKPRELQRYRNIACWSQVALIAAAVLSFIIIVAASFSDMFSHTNEMRTTTLVALLAFIVFTIGTLSGYLWVYSFEPLDMKELEELQSLASKHHKIAVLIDRICTEQCDVTKRDLYHIKSLVWKFEADEKNHYEQLERMQARNTLCQIAREASGK